MATPKVIYNQRHSTEITAVMLRDSTESQTSDFTSSTSWVGSGI